jgi:hypothetical protein
LDEDVLDTNVFVSAVLKLNSLPFFVVCWIDQHAGLLKSAVTEQEILNVLARPHIAALTVPSYRKDLAKLLASAELIAITERGAACRDPTEFPGSGARRRRARSAARSGRSAPLPAGLRCSMGLRGPWITWLDASAAGAGVRRCRQSAFSMG